LPGLLARLPYDPEEAAPRVAQRHHEQAWAAVAVCAGHARHGAFAVVDLNFLAGGESEPVELRRLLGHHAAGEALDAVVGASEAKPIDQLLVDRRVVAAQVQPLGDEGAVRLARRDGATGNNRWPGWGI